jgi:hypothetical protein
VLTRVVHIFRVFPMGSGSRHRAYGENLAPGTTASAICSRIMLIQKNCYNRFAEPNQNRVIPIMILKHC